MTAPFMARTRQAQDYLAAVEHELADLPADDRSALLEDLSLHLDALAAEDDDRSIAQRLGPAAAYAAELRAAAGLPARGSVALSATVGLRERLDRVRATPAFQRWLPALRDIRRLLGELRPAWWVLRGYLLVLVPCVVEGDGVQDFPVPAPLGSHVLGLLLILAAVAASVALGRRMLREPLRKPVGALVTAGGVVLVLASWVAWQGEWSRGAPGYGYDYASMAPEQAIGEYPLLSRHGPVTDVLPYAADGTPLDGVLLYDQDGRPLQVGFQEWWADDCARVLDQPLAADGVAVSNSYPQNYVLDPAGVDLSRSVLRPPGTCVTDPPRPDVPLPVFPPSEPDPAAAPAPAPVPGG